jgi:hypothetical protein
VTCKRQQSESQEGGKYSAVAFQRKIYWTYKKERKKQRNKETKKRNETKRNETPHAKQNYR